MAATTSSTTTQPVTGQQQGQGDGEASRIQSIEDIQREQREQRGMLEQLIARIPGGKTISPDPGTSTATTAGGTPGLDIGSIQDTVRRQIDEADRRREADKQERDWREDVTKTVETIKAERLPREPQTGVRALLRRAMYGRDA